jgi:hypothetical protein
VTWEPDGRRGTTTVGRDELHGIAVSRDPAAHLVLFRLDAANNDGAPREFAGHRELIIWEGAFVSFPELSPQP